MSNEFKRDGSHLAYCPPVEKWEDWVELDPEAWPRRVEKHYSLVPTICFNCESACGLLAYVDKESGQGCEVRGQSDASRQPRAVVRQGAGDDQSDSRSGSSAVSDEAQWGTRSREVDADIMGGSAGDVRHAHSQGDPGRARRRSDVSRGAPGARLHHGADAAGVGHRRA